MSRPLPPLVVHVTCPLCGMEVGGRPLRCDEDYPLSLLRAEVVGAAWEHCYERHPEASDIVHFHVDSDTINTPQSKVKRLQLEWLEPIPLPVPPEQRRVIERRRQRLERQSALDQVFMQTVRNLGRPATTGEIGRLMGMEGRGVRPCAERLARVELVETLRDGRWQAR